MKLLKIVEEKKNIIESLKDIDTDLMIRKLESLSKEIQENDIEEVDVELLYIIAEQFLFTRYEDKFGDWKIECKGYRMDSANTTEMIAYRNGDGMVLTSSKLSSSKGELVNEFAKDLVIQYVKDPYFCIDISDNKYPNSILYKQFLKYAI